MVLLVHRTVGLIRDGENGGGGGGGGWRWGGEEDYIHIATLSPPERLLLKMGCDESRFNVSVGSDGQSHKTVSTTTTFLKRKESRSGFEPRFFRLPA